MSPRVPIAVSGIGVVCGFGAGRRLYWDRLSATPAEALFPEQAAAGKVPEVDAEAILGRDLRRVGRISRYVQVAMHEALQDARIPAEAFRHHGAVLLATTHGAIEYSQVFHRELVQEGPETSNPALFSESLFNVPTTHLTLLTGLQGTATTLVGDGTAFYEALRLALTFLQHGRCRWAACAAAEELISLLFRGYRSCGGWLSRVLREEAPEGVPGEASRGLAEGAVVLILERLEEVSGRGAAAYAVVEEPVGAWVGRAWETEVAFQETRAVDAALLGGHPRAPALPEEERFLEAVLGDAAVGMAAVRPLLGEGFEVTAALQVAWGVMALRHRCLRPAVSRNSRSPNRREPWHGPVRRLLCVTASSREALGACLLAGVSP